MEYMDPGSLDTLIGHPEQQPSDGESSPDQPVVDPQSDFDTATRLPGGPKVGGILEDVLARITASMVRGLKFLKDELNVMHRGRDSATYILLTWLTVAGRRQTDECSSKP